MSDYRPPPHSAQWAEQVERITRCLSLTESKKEMEAMSLMYVLDTEYSRSAITQALHDVEIAKGWK